MSATGRILLSDAQLEQWRAETATPFERAAVVDKLEAAFSGVAQVGSGALPRTAIPAMASRNSVRNAHEDLALGITGNHFWIIASYADVVRGAIATAIVVCASYGIPGWLCSTAGYLLATWSADWGYASNHEDLGGSVLVATRNYRWSLVANRAKSVPRVAGTPQPPSP